MVCAVCLSILVIKPLGLAFILLLFFIPMLVSTLTENDMGLSFNFYYTSD